MDVGILSGIIIVVVIFKVEEMYLEFMSGLGSSALAATIFHPFETIKINQINSKKSIGVVVKKLIADGGVRQFYRSLPIGCAAYASTYGIYFPINRYIKNKCENSTSCHKYVGYMLATIPATFVAMSVTNPMWTIKSVQATTCEKLSIFECAKKIYASSGPLGFQRGLLFGYANGLNGIITFTLYDIFKDLMDAKTSTDYSICSGLSKTLAYFITYPILVLRIKQQIEQDTMKNVIMRQSFKSVYYGLPITLAQMVPKTALMMVLYENFLLTLKNII